MTAPHKAWKKLDWDKIADVEWGRHASEQVDEVLYQGHLADEEPKRRGEESPR